MPFWPLCCESEASLFKRFRPGNRAGVFISGVSYAKIFIPATEISVAKDEISVTGSARPLIWTHRYFYKEKSGEARSRKPSQPGRPGSYEEALRVYTFNVIDTWHSNILAFSSAYAMIKFKIWWRQNSSTFLAEPNKSCQPSAHST